jgi:hypothetical protein
MNVPELLDELVLAPDIEVVVTSLPKGIPSAQGKPSCDSLLQRLNGFRETAALRFIDEQVHMLGHDNVSIDTQAVFLLNAS